ncbi:MAG: FKBP-type peptidyl-prolyl cis-trans isomerase [Bacteroidia bacterium]
MFRQLLVLALAIFSLQVAAQNKNQKQVKQPKKGKIKVNQEYTTASGLRYRVTELGKGKQVEAGDKATVHYTGKLTNGTKFDSSKDRNQPFTFKVGAGQVIKGWDEGLQLLKVGDKATFVIPAELAYGDRDMGSIPPKSTLVFDIEVLDAKAAPKIVPFDTKGKDTVTTASGLRYINIVNGTGAQAQSGKTVKVHYTGYLMDGKVFDSSIERDDPISFPLGNGMVIRGWEEGIALMKVGDKKRLIIPSELGYGERGAGGGLIPANATLIFDVELVEVQ